MKYLLFGGEQYYASGGANDFVAGSDNLLELVSKGQSLMGARPSDGWFSEFEWWHILDTESRKIVESSECKPYGADSGAMNESEWRGQG